MRFSPIFLAFVAGLAMAVPATADKGGGHNGDTSPGNSGDHKVVICHHAGPNKVITITVDNSSQLKHHLNHGDTEGPCPTTPPPTDTTPTPTDTTPTPTDTTPTPTVTDTVPTPGVVNPPVSDEPGTPTVTETTPEQLVAPDRVGGKKHKASPKTVARVRREQRQLVQAVAQARAREQLPYTGLPVLVVLGAGLLALGSGSALRRRA
jgi:hypothetical protein